MTGRPPKGRTWSRRGITPRAKVSGRSRGRLSVAGLLCFRPGLPARLCYRLRRHTGRKGERRSLGETDYIRLLDGAHQLLKAPLIAVWDRLSTHIAKTMKALVAEWDWLTVVLLPGYAPDLNPGWRACGYTSSGAWPTWPPAPSASWRLCSASGSRRCSTGTASSADS